MRWQMLQCRPQAGASQPIYFSWCGREEEDGEGWCSERWGAQEESLAFTDCQIFCGLFSSSSCHCLFDSDHPVPSQGKALLHIQCAATIRLRWMQGANVSVVAYFRRDNQLSVRSAFTLHTGSGQWKPLADALSKDILSGRSQDTDEAKCQKDFFF